MSGGSTNARALADKGTGLFSLPEEIPESTVPFMDAPITRRLFDLLSPLRNVGFRDSR